MIRVFKFNCLLNQFLYARGLKIFRMNANCWQKADNFGKSPNISNSPKMSLNRMTRNQRLKMNRLQQLPGHVFVFVSIQNAKIEY